MLPENSLYGLKKLLKAARVHSALYSPVTTFQDRQGTSCPEGGKD